MFITGPDVTKTVTGEDVTFEELGGAQTHARRSGVAHFVARDEDEMNEQTRRLLSFIPSNNLDDPPRFETGDDPQRLCPELDGLIPDAPNKPYDIKTRSRPSSTTATSSRVAELFAQNIVIGFGRVAGGPVGIVANQPKVLAGVLDIDSSIKAARFVRFCDAFNIPLVTFVDVPGFLPGTGQEYGGIIKHGAKLLYAYAEATVPKITVITRKAYGGAYDVMASKHIRADFNIAWPTAEIAVMGAEAPSRRSSGARSPKRPIRRRKTRRSIAEYRSGSPTRSSPRSAATSTTSSSRAGRAGGRAGARDARDQTGRPAGPQARQHPAVAGARPVHVPVSLGGIARWKDRTRHGRRQPLVDRNGDRPRAARARRPSRVHLSGRARPGRGREARGGVGRWALLPHAT